MNVTLLQEEWAQTTLVLGVFSTHDKAVEYMKKMGWTEASEGDKEGYFLIERTVDAELAKLEPGWKPTAS